MLGIARHKILLDWLIDFIFIQLFCSGKALKVINSLLNQVQNMYI